MNGPILIIHAPDYADQASLLCESLELAGFLAFTFEEILGDTTHSTIREKWSTIASFFSAFIFLASPRLFENDFLIEMAHEALSTKKFIPLIYGYRQGIPSWFLNKSIDISPDEKDTVRGWNRLVAILNRFVGILYSSPN